LGLTKSNAEKKYLLARRALGVVARGKREGADKEESSRWRKRRERKKSHQTKVNRMRTMVPFKALAAV
jgi:hypothetical protein